MSVRQLLKRRQEQPLSSSFTVHLAAWTTFWAFWSFQSCRVGLVLPDFLLLLPSVFLILGMLGFVIAWRRKERLADSQLALAALMFIGFWVFLWVLPTVSRG